LRDLGWVEGHNVVVVHQWSEGRYERLAELARELAAMPVDVIIAPSSIYTGAAKGATSTIPIIFFSHADPIGTGHVGSLARPGGNVTGLSLLLTETSAKSVELLKEVVPGLSRVAALLDPATPSSGPLLNALETGGASLKIRVVPVPVRTPAEFDGAFERIARDGADGVVVLSTPMFIASAKRLAELAIEHRLPSLFGPKEHAEAGGLLSYGPDRVDLWRRGATYVDAILRGASPGELPVQQPNKFELVVNMRTAKALGLSIPPTLLARADEVIE
jgi:putative tryptophan/tyrosine transport system substrate-binding protein